ncbi:MAG TPA: bifunctional tetrahydrofolate synthase/dihydrofolate synthase [Rudaea sp.]|nr:bifunctional tetrahydrofolate synthase/dihydrofolate synthase [Rudaea sp.]
MRALAEWLDYQQRIHPRDVELGLGRVGEVWRRMGAPRPASVVVTVGGTNGKGSTVAFLEAMLAADGKRVGCYTSPHLLRYNERVRVCGADVADAVLIDAFERIESARKNIALTYFEFGTLAGLWIFAHSELDVAVLEVGLGGRLDAINIIDADAAIVTTVDLDHMDWLGSDRDSIGREKAGIFRPRRPAIVGMRNPPQGLLAEAERIDAQLLMAGRDFAVAPQIDAWRWQSNDKSDGRGADADTASVTFADPKLAGGWQIDNAAAAIAALHALRERIGWNAHAIAAGVATAKIAARVQRFVVACGPDLIVDVAHNPQAADALAHWLAQQRTQLHNLAVFGALRDKDVGAVILPLLAHIDTWFGADLHALTPRGLNRDELLQRMPASAAAAISAHASVTEALDAAAAAAGESGQIIAFGSFFVAAAALEWANGHGYRPAS